MAPAIHPACTPQASCTPVRCHPSGPPCKNPEKCLRRTISKNLKPCQSAVSIMRTRSKASCSSSCGRFASKTTKPRSIKRVRKYLKRKTKEAKLRKKDRLTGKHRFLKYQRKKGKKRSKTQCCAGKGHRGRVKKSKCTIL